MIAKASPIAKATLETHDKLLAARYQEVVRQFASQNLNLEDAAWLYLDMNSYFASVEQEMKPQLRGKPVDSARALF